MGHPRGIDLKRRGHTRVPYRHQPLVAANRQLPPQGGCRGEAFRQRSGDDRAGERGGGEEGERQKRSEHILNLVMRLSTMAIAGGIG